MLCLENKKLHKVIILFDDAVSELDPGRTERVYSVLENRGQLFIASPSGNPPLAGLRPFRVTGGAVSAL